MKKAKLKEIEILRGLAFLAVVMQHVIAGLFYQPGLSPGVLTAGTTFLGLTRYAVPLFVFITGVVLFYNYDGKLQFGSFLRKRFLQVVVPYLAWTVFYYAWVSLLSGGSAKTTWMQLYDILNLFLTGKASYHLWFMVMIIPFYLLFPLFRLLLSKRMSWQIHLVIVASILVINLVLVYALSQGKIISDNPSFGFIFDYLDRNFIFWIFYFMLGGLAGTYYEQWKAFVRKTWLFSAGLLVLCMVQIYLKVDEINIGVTDNPYLFSSNVTAPLKPFMMATILLLILLVFLLAEKIAARSGRTARLLGTFGKYSFGAYLIHAFVLKLVNESVIAYMGFFGVYARTLVAFILCSLLSVGLCMLLSRIKMSFGELSVGKA